MPSSARKPLCPHCTEALQCATCQSTCVPPDQITPESVLQVFSLPGCVTSQKGRRYLCHHNILHTSRLVAIGLGLCWF